MILKLAIATIMAFLVGSATLSVLAYGIQTQDEQRVAKIREKIRKLGAGEKSSVKVKLIDSTAYEGYVSRSGENDFLLIDKVGNQTTIRYSEVDSVKDRGLSTLSRIGIGIGIGFAAVAAAVLIGMAADK